MDKGQWRYRSVLVVLMITAIVLTARATYLYLADPLRFPINTIKVTAVYQHVLRQQFENILNEALNKSSFFTLPVQKLRDQLKSLPWTKSITIERIWPDTLKINLVENNPVAIWNDLILMEDGKLFNLGRDFHDLRLPHLRGPNNQQQEVLQIYQKMSKILSIYGFYIALLEKRHNQAWELTLDNGIRIDLGKHALEAKIIRFCKAYPAVFEGKLDSLVSVDLRYPRGMAVKWNDKTGK